MTDNNVAVARGYPDIVVAPTALRPYGTPVAPITPGVTWEDHLAAEADDAQAH